MTRTRISSSSIQVVERAEARRSVPIVLSIDTSQLRLLSWHSTEFIGRLVSCNAGCRYPAFVLSGKSSSGWLFLNDDAQGSLLLFLKKAGLQGIDFDARADLDVKNGAGNGLQRHRVKWTCLLSELRCKLQDCACDVFVGKIAGLLQPRWHRWIARPPPKGQVEGSSPSRGASLGCWCA